MKKIINLKDKPTHLIINRLAVVLKEERIYLYPAGNPYQP